MPRPDGTSGDADPRFGIKEVALPPQRQVGDVECAAKFGLVFIGGPGEPVALHFNRTVPFGRQATEEDFIFFQDRAHVINGPGVDSISMKSSSLLRAPTSQRVHKRPLLEHHDGPSRAPTADGTKTSLTSTPRVRAPHAPTKNNRLAPASISARAIQ